MTNMEMQIHRIHYVTFITMLGDFEAEVMN
jgi:hypothetical protein